MADLENASIENIEGTQTVDTSMQRLLRWAKEWMYEVVTGKIPLSKALHPDFRLAWEINERLTWYQNREWTLPNPRFKVGFFVNDLHTLDDCPWVCKFGNNRNKKRPEFKYFCVAFGDPRQWNTGYGLDEMIEWAKQFDHPTLVTYAGKYVRDLNSTECVQKVQGPLSVD